MKSKTTIEEKAIYFINKCRRNIKESYLAEDGYNNRILACEHALVIVDEIINTCYWWQIKRKLFYQGVKIFIIVDKAKTAKELFDFKNEH